MPYVFGGYASYEEDPIAKGTENPVAIEPYPYKTNVWADQYLSQSGAYHPKHQGQGIQSGGLGQSMPGYQGCGACRGLGDVAQDCLDKGNTWNFETKTCVQGQVDPGDTSKPGVSSNTTMIVGGAIALGLVWFLLKK